MEVWNLNISLFRLPSECKWFQSDPRQLSQVNTVFWLVDSDNTELWLVDTDTDNTELWFVDTDNTEFLLVVINNTELWLVVRMFAAGELHRRMGQHGQHRCVVSRGTWQDVVSASRMHLRLLRSNSITKFSNRFRNWFAWWNHVWIQLPSCAL